MSTSRRLRVRAPLPMTTFDAIAQIRREALSRTQALRFLMEHLGFTVIYAREVIVAVFGDEQVRANEQVAPVDGTS